LSIGDDHHHSLAIYDWANQRLVTSSKVARYKITDCKFKTNTEFVTCGLGQIRFWLFNGVNIAFRKGSMKTEQFEPLTCVVFAFSAKICITGTTKGNIIVWNETEILKKIPAHKTQVWALMAKGNGLVSGGQDGILIVWSNEFKQLSSIDMSKFISSDPGIRAIDVSAEGAYVIGTKGAEIIMVQQGRTTILVNGHSNGQLWGLCVSPNADKFATCGGDKSLCVWEIGKLFAALSLSEDARAIDWSSNGEFIALGSLEGFIYTFNPNDNLNGLSKLQGSFDKGQWIEDIKISPNNTMIAFGVRKGASRVEIMKVNEKGDSLSKCYFINVGFTAGLTHIDWDATSSYLMINSQACELKFVNVGTQAIQSGATSKDLDWYTWSCCLGFGVQGILPFFSDGLDVNSACRSHDRKVIATGDDYSKVKLFKYPSVVRNAGFKEYKGHTGWVTRVRFLWDDRHLISIGGYDKTIIVWATDILTDSLLDTDDTFSPLNIDQDMMNIYNEVDTTQLDQQITELRKKVTKQMSLEKVYKLLTPKIEEDKSDFLGSKSWIGQMRESKEYTKPPFNQSKPPKVQLTLDYVYGYDIKHCRNNLAYLQNGEIVYHTAAIGVILNKETNTQRFFTGHIGSIMSIALHPDKIRVATGDYGVKPYIYIWNSNTCLPVASFRGYLEKGIKSLAFSPNGEYLAAVDISPYNSVAIYDLHNKELLFISKTDPLLLLQVVFKNNEEFITVGIMQFINWRITNAGLNSKSGIFKGYNNILGCVAADNDLVLTGNVLGEIYQWKGNIIVISKKVHNGPIDCITIAQDL